MATEDRPILARPHSADDLDAVFEALAHSSRRAIIGELDWGEPRGLDDLAAVIADDESRSVADVRVALAHNHLPHLADAGVITYDRSEQVCELDDAVTERAVLNVITETD